MSDNDFDDFFEVDSEGNAAPEKSPPAKAPAPTPTPPVAKPPAASPTPPAAAPPVPPPEKPAPSMPEVGSSKPNDSLMSDFGDFDALFNKAEPDAPPPPLEDSGIDDLLSDFSEPEEGEKTQIREIPVPSAAPPPPPVAKVIPKPAPPPPPPSRPKKDNVSQPEEALEELFSEVSRAETEIPEEASGDVLESGLGLEFKQRRQKWIKLVVVGLSSTLMFVGAVSVLMARFSPNGFMGWKWGQKPADGYEPPSARVLEQLRDRFALTDSYFVSDRYEDYKKAAAELSSILKIDSRNSPTDARYAEVLLLMGDKTVSAEERKTITFYIGQSEKFHPEIVQTLRTKSRLQLLDEQYPQAEVVAKKALSVSPQDAETLMLLGEIALARGDLDPAAQYFMDASAHDSKLIRPQYFLGIARLQQGNIDEAEKIFKNLALSPPYHPRSEMELWKLVYAHRENQQGAKEGLRTLVETKATGLSNYDLGRAWRALAEISESQKDLASATASMEKSVEADRSSHSNAYYLGRLYLAQKQFEKSANEFRRASSLAPQSAEYLIYEGNALRELGKVPESLTELQKALEKEPLNVEGLFQLGLTQRALSRNEEAISSFESVLKSDPRHLDAMLNLSELYMARDNFTLAKSDLKSAITIDPKSVRARNNMGKLLLTQRKFDEALEEFKLAESVDSKNVDVLSNLGRAYLALNQIDKAASYLDRALSIDPTLLDTQVATGELQHRKKEFIKASETYRNVLKARPKDYDTRVKLAAVLIDQSSFQEAVQELQEASKWNPNYYPTRLNLGIAWRGLGNLDASLEQIQIALQLRPEAAEAHYQLEMTQIYRNDALNAETAMNKAISFDPKYIDPLVSLGDYFDTRNLYLKAVEYYLKAEKAQPSNPEVLLKIADSYRKNGEYNKKALAYYEKTLKADRRNVDALIGASLVLEDNGNLKMSLKYLKQAQAIDPNDPRPYYYLGFLYKDTPNKKAAILNFRKYLQLDPNSKEKKDIEDQIYDLTH